MQRGLNAGQSLRAL
ncbi:hypothetical protein, partial [Acidithiobacillus ferriphilus]